MENSEELWGWQDTAGRMQISGFSGMCKRAVL